MRERMPSGFTTGMGETRRSKAMVGPEVLVPILFVTAIARAVFHQNEVDVPRGSEHDQQSKKRKLR